MLSFQGCSNLQKSKGSVSGSDYSQKIADTQSTFSPSSKSAEILKELNASNKYDGDALSQDQLLKTAKSKISKSDPCAGAKIRLNASNAAIYIAEADNISKSTAVAIEAYTNKKIEKDEAIKIFNSLVSSANNLKHWGDANEVLGACGPKTIVDRIAKSNSSKNYLFDQFRILLTQQ